jgi:pyruvate/2-oxoglutarate/acetoin dehydrogenase E1 component
MPINVTVPALPPTMEEGNLAKRLVKRGGKDVPMPYAANLEKLALPSAAEVVEAVNAVTCR